jgi:hypothetical protein
MGQFAGYIRLRTCLRGPYWYFHYREGGKQKTLYIGKSEEPETAVDRKR